jgi:hypothetical protein
MELNLADLQKSKTKMKEDFLKKVFAQAVVQGRGHRVNIERIFKLLRYAVENEFTEDNAITLDVFMLELFEKSQSIYYKNQQQKKSNRLYRKHPHKENPAQGISDKEKV